MVLKHSKRLHAPTLINIKKYGSISNIVKEYHMLELRDYFIPGDI